MSLTFRKKSCNDEERSPETTALRCTSKNAYTADHKKKRTMLQRKGRDGERKGQGEREESGTRGCKGGGMAGQSGGGSDRERGDGERGEGGGRGGDACGIVAMCACTYAEEFLRLLRLPQHVLAVVQGRVPRVQQKRETDLASRVFAKSLLKQSNVEAERQRPREGCTGQTAVLFIG